MCLGMAAERSLASAAGKDPRHLDWTVTTDRPDWLATIAPTPVALNTLIPVEFIIELIWSHKPTQDALGIANLDIISDEKIDKSEAAKLKKADGALFLHPKTLRGVYHAFMAQKNRSQQLLDSTSQAASNLDTDGL